MGNAREDFGPGAPGADPPPVLERHPLLRDVTVGAASLVAAALVLVLLVKGFEILLAAFGGLLLGVLLQAPASLLRRVSPLSYPWSLTLVLLLLLGVMGLCVGLLAPQVAEQIDQLIEKVPVLISNAEATLERYGWGRWLLEQGSNGFPEAALRNTAGHFSGLMDITSYLLVALFVGLFAASSPRMYIDGFVGLTPPRAHGRVREILGELGSTLRWWLLGQGVTMIITGVSTMIVMWIFGLPLAVVIGLIVGLLSFIPYLGPIVGAVPVAMIAMTEGLDTLLYVMAAYIGVQMLEGYVATPMVHARTVYLPPVFTIVTQVLLGAVLGMIGFVLATPLAAVLLVLSRF